VPSKQYVYRYDIDMKGLYNGRNGGDFVNFMTARGE
jgi:hypothetical protein